MRYLLAFDLDTGDITGHLAVPYGVMPDIAKGQGCWATESVYQWERAIRVGPSGLELVSDPIRQDPAAIVISRDDLLQQHGHYRANRREAYDPVPEQLDRITKALSVLHAQGINIGLEGREQVAHCEQVKSRFPKPVV